MPAALYNINAEQGATFLQTVLYTDAADDPIDLTSYTAAMHVRDGVANASTIVTLTTENGGITLGGAAGTIELTIAAVDTTALAAGKYVYDLELYGPSDLIIRLIEGRFNIKAEVTRQ